MYSTSSVDASACPVCGAGPSVAHTVPMCSGVTYQKDSKYLRQNREFRVHSVLSLAYRWVHTGVWRERAPKPADKRAGMHIYKWHAEAMLEDQSTRIADEHAPRLVERNEGSAHLTMTRAAEHLMPGSGARIATGQLLCSVGT